jgi:hypothetical protein
MRPAFLPAKIRTLAIAAGLATVLAAAGQTAALARDWDDDGDGAWQRHEWREHEWREHEWREHEWREHYRPYVYGYPPGYYVAPGYAYPPPVVYPPAPPPAYYYGAPSLSLGFSFR